MTDANDIENHVSAALRDASQVEGVPADTPLLDLKRVGIVGAGTMGVGIAMNFANIGIPVHIVETRQAALDRGLDTMRKHYARSAQRGRFPIEEIDIRMGRVTCSLTIDDLANCDLVIEAVYEDLALKQGIFQQLDKVAKPDAILASNTSGLDVNQIAAVTSRPESVIGLHFFSPANVMKLIEIVRGEKTSAAVIATCLAMSKGIDKIAVVVGVCPGFVGNRMLYPRQLQAHALLRRGAMPWDVDCALKAFGFKMGPFEMSDLAGLDIGWTKGAKTGDRLRDALCERDRRGQKTGAGFYDYDANRIASPSQEVAQLIHTLFPAPADAKTPTDEEILESCLFPMINEGAKILQEGVAQRASDIDVVWLFGYNWPRHTGGPMRWADDIGLHTIVAKAVELGEASDWYKPAQLLRDFAAKDGRLSDYRGSARRP